MSVLESVHNVKTMNLRNLSHSTREEGSDIGVHVTRSDQ
jgi:hypothetical protein